MTTNATRALPRPAMHLTIAVEEPDQPEIHAMIAESDAFYATLYPPESNHLLDIASLQEPGVTFLVARADGAIGGYGAVVRRAEGFGEVKRMYVAPPLRGYRIGRLLLDALERHARDAGLSVLRLETGISQPAAIGLYRTAGYCDIEPFPPYRPDPLSLFMEKRIAPDA